MLGRFPLMSKYLVWDILPFWLTHLFALLLVGLDPVAQKYLLPPGMIAGQIGMIGGIELPVIPVLKRIKGSYDNIFWTTTSDARCL